ncbi:uncharacterized protein [Ambystoma mexicanum]|uniref:uncharacterized protein isoform X2 n=1 Tax=Ambystoma mexicanum TaxID=8296 RepID=UPI0037E81B90
MFHRKRAAFLYLFTLLTHFAGYIFLLFYAGYQFLMQSFREADPGNELEVTHSGGNWLSHFGSEIKRKAKSKIAVFKMSRGDEVPEDVCRTPLYWPTNESSVDPERVFKMSRGDEVPEDVCRTPLYWPTNESSVDPERGSTSTKIYIGLSNQGSTCYLNSLLQCLYLTPEFKEKFSTCTNMSSETVSAVWEIFCKLDERNQYVTTSRLTSSLGLTSFKQQDVPEIFQMLLNKMDDGPSKGSHFKEVFSSTLVNLMECSECNQKDGLQTGCNIVTLPLVVSTGRETAEPLTVAQSLELFQRSSMMTKENQIYCSVCKKKTDTALRQALTKVPPVLVVQLKRFEYNFSTNSFMKLETEICIDRILEVQYEKSATEQETKTYELFAICEHYGGLRGGHYTALIKPDGEKWYRFNDLIVETVEIETQQKTDKDSLTLWRNERNNLSRSTAAYLLMYRQKKTDSQEEKEAPRVLTDPCPLEQSAQDPPGQTDDQKKIIHSIPQKDCTAESIQHDQQSLPNQGLDTILHTDDQEASERNNHLKELNDCAAHNLKINQEESKDGQVLNKEANQEDQKTYTDSNMATPQKMLKPDTYPIDSGQTLKEQCPQANPNAGHTTIRQGTQQGTNVEQNCNTERPQGVEPKTHQEGPTAEQTDNMEMPQNELANSTAPKTEVHQNAGQPSENEATQEDPETNTGMSAYTNQSDIESGQTPIIETSQENRFNAERYHNLEAPDTESNEIAQKASQAPSVETPQGVPEIELDHNTKMCTADSGSAHTPNIETAREERNDYSEHRLCYRLNIGTDHCTRTPQIKLNTNPEDSERTPNTQTPQYDPKPGNVSTSQITHKEANVEQVLKTESRQDVTKYPTDPKHNTLQEELHAEETFGREPPQREPVDCTAPKTEAHQKDENNGQSSKSEAAQEDREVVPNIYTDPQQGELEFGQAKIIETTQKKQPNAELYQKELLAVPALDTKSCEKEQLAAQAATSKTPPGEPPDATEISAQLTLEDSGSVHVPSVEADKKEMEAYTEHAQMKYHEAQVSGQTPNMATPQDNSKAVTDHDIRTAQEEQNVDTVLESSTHASNRETPVAYSDQFHAELKAGQGPDRGIHPEESNANTDTDM